MENIPACDNHAVQNVTSVLNDLRHSTTIREPRMGIKCAMNVLSIQPQMQTGQRSTYNEAHLIANMGGNKTNRTRNLAKSKFTKISHHCSECKRPISEQCFKNLHFAYCDVNMCNERFQVISPSGCRKHPYSEGDNLLVKQQRSKSPNYVPYDFVLAEKEKAKKEAEEKEKAIEREKEMVRQRTFDKDWKKVDESKVVEDKEAKEKSKKKTGKVGVAMGLKQFITAQRRKK